MIKTIAQGNEADPNEGPRRSPDFKSGISVTSDSENRKLRQTVNIHVSRKWETWSRTDK